MTRVTITRWAYFPWATVGEIAVLGTTFRAAVLELPWNNNEELVSCILHGLYRIKRDTFRGKYENYKILDVPGRKDVEIHRGNTVEDTEGCPLIGTGVRIDTEEKTAVLYDSAKAFKSWIAAMGGADEAELEIREVSARLM